MIESVVWYFLFWIDKNFKKIFDKNEIFHSRTNSIIQILNLKKMKNTVLPKDCGSSISSLLNF